MRRWFCKSLGDGMLAGEPLRHIERLFAAEYEKAGRPDGMAAFVRYESEGRLHCDVNVYFSPEAAVVAGEVGASPCAKPTPNDLGLLAGAERSRAILFSEHSL